MREIIIEGCFYYVHPIYNLCAASQYGDVIDLLNTRLVMKKMFLDELYCMVKKYNETKTEQELKLYRVDRFIWECFHGIIPKGNVINHFNNDKEDNRICNLLLITQREIKTK